MLFFYVIYHGWTSYILKLYLLYVFIFWRGDLLLLFRFLTIYFMWSLTFFWEFFVEVGLFFSTILSLLISSSEGIDIFCGLVLSVASLTKDTKASAFYGSSFKSIELWNMLILVLLFSVNTICMLLLIFILLKWAWYLVFFLLALLSLLKR